MKYCERVGIPLQTLLYAFSGSDLTRSIQSTRMINRNDSDYRYLSWDNEVLIWRLESIKAKLVSIA